MSTTVHEVVPTAMRRPTAVSAAGSALHETVEHIMLDTGLAHLPARDR